MSYQYLHIVRMCDAGTDLCHAEDSTQLDVLWTNITECCITHRCNHQTVNWVEVNSNENDQVGR